MTRRKEKILGGFEKQEQCVGRSKTKRTMHVDPLSFSQGTWLYKASRGFSGFSWLKEDSRGSKGSTWLQVVSKWLHGAPSLWLCMTPWSSSWLNVDPRCSTEFLLASRVSAWLQELRVALRVSAHNSKLLDVTPRSFSWRHVLTRILNARKLRPCLAPCDSKGLISEGLQPEAL